MVDENNHPLAGAHVVSNADDKNRAQFSVTNFKGWVELNVKKNSFIKVSHVGFYDFIDKTILFLFFKINYEIDFVL